MASDIDKKGWVVYFDVYGFSTMVITEDRKTLRTRLLNAWNAIQARVFKPPLIPMRYMFSDSIFLFYSSESSSETEDPRDNKYLTLIACLEDIQRIMEVFINQDLPLRGSMAYGEVITDTNILIGNPVLQAVAYERLNLYPCVLLPAYELSVGDNVWDCMEYPISHPFTRIPLKDKGTMLATLIMPYPLSTFTLYVQKQITHYSLHGPYAVASAWVLMEEMLQSLPHRDQWR